MLMSFSKRKQKIFAIVSLLLITVIGYYWIMPIRQAHYFNNNSDTSFQYIKLYNDVKLQLMDSIINLNKIDTFQDFALNNIKRNPYDWWIDTMIFDKGKSRFVATVVSMYTQENASSYYNRSGFVIGERISSKWSFYFKSGFSIWWDSPKSYTKVQMKKTARRFLMYYYYDSYSFNENPQFWNMFFWDDRKKLIELNAYEFKYWDNYKHQ